MASKRLGPVEFAGRHINRLGSAMLPRHEVGASPHGPHSVRANCSPNVGSLDECSKVVYELLVSQREVKHS